MEGSVQHILEDWKEEGDVFNATEPEFSVGLTLLGHQMWVLSLIYFQNHRKLVSCGADCKIRIWNTGWEKNVTEVKGNDHCISEFSDWVRHLVKFDDYSFLACGYQKEIVLFSILEPYEKLKVLSMNSSKVLRLLKLPEASGVSRNDIFLSLNKDGQIFVCSVSQNAVLKELSFQPVDTFSKLILSKQHENCFYINTVDRKNSVKLIDIKTNERTKMTFKKHKFYIYSIEVFISRGEELLAAGGFEKKIFIYSSENGDLVREIETKLLECLKCINNRYLFVGDDEGTLEVIDLNKMIKIGSKKISGNGNGITDILPFHYSEEEDHTLSMFVSFRYLIKGSRDYRNQYGESSQNMICLVKVSDLKLFEIDFLQGLEDMKERTGFLSIPSYDEEVMEQYGIFLSINLLNMKMDGVFKSFLL